MVILNVLTFKQQEGLFESQVDYGHSQLKEDAAKDAYQFESQVDYGHSQLRRL